MAKDKMSHQIDGLKNGEYFVYSWTDPDLGNKVEITVVKNNGVHYFYLGNAESEFSGDITKIPSDKLNEMSPQLKGNLSKSPEKYTIEAGYYHDLNEEATTAIKNNSSMDDGDVKSLLEGADVSRDEADNLVVSYPNDNETTTELKYNENNQIISQNTKNSDGTDIETTQFSYNADNKIESVTEKKKNENGEEEVTETKYAYSDKGCTTTKTSSVAGIKTGSVVSSYNSDNKLVNLDEKDRNGKTIRSEVYVYDDKGNKNTFIEHKLDPTTNIRTSTKIEYDSGGNESKVTTTVANGDKATETVVEYQNGTSKTTKYEYDIDPATNTLINKREILPSDAQADSTTPDTSSLTLEQELQLQKDVDEYIKKYNVDEETAKKACRAALTELNNPNNNISVYDGRDEKHPKLDEYINPEHYLDKNLSNLNDLLCPNSKANAKKAELFKDFLVKKLINGKLFNFELTQSQGEATQAFINLMNELKAKAEVVTENAELARQALKIITDELVPNLQLLVAIDAKRDELGEKLGTLNTEYNNILKAKPTPETLTRTLKHADGSPVVVDGVEQTESYTNPEFAAWIVKRDEAQAAIDKLLNEEPITLGEGEASISVTGLIALNAKGKEVRGKCIEILGSEENLEALVKDFKKLYYGNGGGGGNDPGSDPSGGGGTPPTEPPLELPDNTQDQMKYFEDLSIGDLSDIADNLAKFAETNNLTVQELLTDENNAAKLIEYLGSLGVLSEDLKKLINEGDPAKTQALLSNIFTGKQATVVGLDDLTRNVLINNLNNIAAANNTTIVDLLSKDENASLIREELSGYNDIVSKLKGISAENMKSQVTNIYDGNGVDDYSGKTLNTLRDYLDKAANKNNMTIDEYLESDASAANMQNLGKASVLINTISGFDDKTLLETLKSITTSTQ